jgi:hypothetical protein
MDIAKLKKSRGALRRAFTKTKNEIDGLIKNKDGVDFIKTIALIEVLDSHHNALEK